MSVTVSVVIPTYNRARLVAAAIDSVLRQTYRDFEIIVVDDASTDDTERQLRRFGDSIVYLKQERNAGVNASRNLGVRHARGKYIALLDNDDLWLEQKLELQVAVLDHCKQAGFVFSDFSVLKPSGQWIPHGIDRWYGGPLGWARICGPAVTSATLDSEIKTNFNVYVGDIYRQSLLGPVVLPTTALIRRSCTTADLVFPEDDPSCGDWEFFARLSKLHGAAYMDVTTALNRSHEDSVRLTRLPQTVQVARRLDMVRRVWKNDTEFCVRYADDVVSVEQDLLLKLAACQLVEGDQRAARATLRQRTRPRGGVDSATRLRAAACATFAYLPGGSALLGWLRCARHIAERVFRRFRTA